MYVPAADGGPWPGRSGAQPEEQPNAGPLAGRLPLSGLGDPRAAAGPVQDYVTGTWVPGRRQPGYNQNSRHSGRSCSTQPGGIAVEQNLIFGNQTTQKIGARSRRTGCAVSPAPALCIRSSKTAAWKERRHCAFRCRSVLNGAPQAGCSEYRKVLPAGRVDVQSAV